jgi:cobalt-zinc-cadmium efflux system outer membrane protein
MAQSLGSLIADAMKNNPEILAAQKRYEAMRQRPVRESTLPDPMLSVGWASNGNPLPGAGLGSNPTSNIGVSLAQELPGPGKLRLRGEVASKEAEAEFQQYQAVKLSVTARLKLAYHQLHHSYEASDIMRREQKLLGNFMQIAESRYSVGKAAQQDIFRAHAQFAIMETQILRMEQDKAVQQAIINSLLNRPQDTPIAPPAPMQPGDLRVTLDELLAHARTDAPAIMRDQKMVERNELALNLARKSYAPDYVLSGGYFNQGGMPPMYQVRLDVKVPAYFWRRQRAEVTEQTYTVNESRRTYEADRQILAARIRGEYAEAQTARKLMDLYSKSVTPQASLALESSLASYQTGAIDFLSVLTNFMTVVEYELNYHEEMAKFHLSLARLEEMTGLEIDPAR